VIGGEASLLQFSDSSLDTRFAEVDGCNETCAVSKAFSATSAITASAAVTGCGTSTAAADFDFDFDFELILNWHLRFGH
jgi:hypothetical protein